MIAVISMHLISALISVETKGVPHPDQALGDFVHGHPTSFGCLQISQKVLDDVSRISGRRLTAYHAFDRPTAIWICQTYLDYWATKARLGREPTDQDRARIWVSGPNGWQKPESLPYWGKVKAQLDYEESQRTISIGDAFRRNTWQIRNTGAPFVETHEWPMLLPYRPEVSIARRQGDSRMSPLAEELHGLFRRHGKVSSWDDAGSKEQSQGLFTNQLPMGDCPAAEQQHPPQYLDLFQRPALDRGSMGTRNGDRLRDNSATMEIPSLARSALSFEVMLQIRSSPPISLAPARAP